MLSLKQNLDSRPEIRETIPSVEYPAQPGLEADFPIPYLSTIQKYYGNSSNVSIIFGLCEDGLPLITDLRESDPGSFLIIGNSGRENRPLIDTILANLIGTWGDDSLQVLWLSPYNCGSAFHISDPPQSIGLMLERQEVLEFLSQIKQRVMDYRVNGGSNGITVLLIDGLETILHQYGSEVRDRLNWLKIFGRSSGLRIFASFGLDAAFDIDDQTLHSFGLTITGPISNPTWRRYLNGDIGTPDQGLSPGAQYQVVQSGQPLRFWLPRLD